MKSSALRAHEYLKGNDGLRPSVSSRPLATEVSSPNNKNGITGASSPSNRLTHEPFTSPDEHNLTITSARVRTNLKIICLCALEKTKVPVHFGRRSFDKKKIASEDTEGDRANKGRTN